MLPEDIKRQIDYEISEIENELKSYELLIKSSKLKKPDLIEMTALGSVLHSFYNGIERIFLIVSKRIDKYVPQNYNWHAELLKKMLETNEFRKNVITEDMAIKLQEYLAFRHFFRHSYKFRLDWDKMEVLIHNLESIWNQLKEEVKKIS